MDLYEVGVNINLQSWFITRKKIFGMMVDMDGYGGYIYGQWGL